MTVTFFGHKDTPPNVRISLENVLTHLIENEQADMFYVENHGNFDQLVRKVLMELKLKYPHIRYSIVLAYMPRNTNGISQTDSDNTLLPEEVATSIPKFAISKRNHWMLQKSNVVVTYITRSYGGAAKFKKIALAHGKRIIELAEL